MQKLLRRAKANMLRFRPEKPPVLVFGLRRGGSTMGADAICANRGVWFANEPYAMFPTRMGYAEKSRRLFHPPESHFFGLSGDEKAQFSTFTHDLLNVRIKSMGTARHLIMPGLKADRVCLKILNAPWMIDWFQAETDSHIIVILRHPGAQGKSVIRQGWQFPTKAYLARPDFMEQHFTADQRALAQEIFDSGNTWRLAVLDWVITSHPLRQAQGVHRIPYEEIVQNPDGFVQEVLQGACGLTDTGPMLAALKRPSGSSNMSTDSTNQAIASGDTKEILAKWKQHTTEEECAEGQVILDAFGVDDYRFT